jgi:hypothetical protein
MIRLTRLLLASVALCSALLLRADAAEVRQTLWGFDGRVVPSRINPLSVLLANPGRNSFEGMVTLKQGGGLGGRSGALYVQPVFIGPQSERWVQFYPFVSSPDEFTVEWGRGANDRLTLDPPTFGPPARVLLLEADNPFAASAALKSFPEQLFPATVSATDALDAVALDHPPRWEPARREAFLDWVKRGGTLLVLPGQNGEYPAFTEQLAPLNIGGESARVGAGTVLRAKLPRREVSEQHFAERGFPAPELKTSKEPVAHQSEEAFFQRLARLNQPEVRLWLLNSLAALYLLIIGPVQYRLGRRLDYRLSLAFFAGTVALFGWVFSVVGRRGYDEAQAVNAVSIARALGDSRYDVTQWASAFVTTGNLYTLTHAAPSNLYAAVSHDVIRGEILSGKDGVFRSDIPLFSSREFIHRGVLLGDDTSVTVEQWEETDTAAQKLVLKPGPNFPKNAVRIAAKLRDNFYEMELKEGRLVSKETGVTFETFLPKDEVRTSLYAHDRISGAPAERLDQLHRILRTTFPMLLARAVEGRDDFTHFITRPPPPADRLQLYIFAESPAGFHLRTPGFTRQMSYTLYVQEVFKP